MRRALVIGLDDYPSCDLQGCVKDAQRLDKVLSRHHDQRINFNCETITSPPTTVTRPLLRKKIADLFKHPADVAFLHFSGHGTVNGLGGYLVTPDYCEYDVGIAMTEVLALANQSPVTDVFITLDCCHSGAFGVLPAVSDDKVILADGVSVITATRLGQEALEEGGGGVFSSLLVEALEGGAAGLLGEVSAASIYAYIDNALGAWDQRPLFKANVSRFVRLREAAPRLQASLVQKLTEYFPLPAEPLKLSPEYEPEVEPHDDKKEDTFRYLQKFRNAGLVEPLGSDHMYYAAINSKECGLTTLGKYYWRLVKENKI
ncbi:MAG: caspase family protein [Deltaproteobacteria bacterium]|nr:caspase family protein [Deltaproteobacteria bacterium]